MKHFYLSVFTLLLTAASASAEVVSYTATDGFVYSIDTDAKEATLAEVPQDAGITTLTVPDAVTYNSTHYPVVAVADRAGILIAGYLTSIKLGANIRTIGERAFYGAANCSRVTLPDNLVEIGGYAFYNCRVMPDITFPEGLKTIGNFAFYNCYAIENVSIPASVTTIGANPWGSCTELKKIEVAADNPNYKSIDNVLFSKDGSLLVSYPIGRNVISYTVPIGCKIIGSNSMRNNSKMTSIVLPEGLDSIGDGAFNVCMFSQIILPASLTKLGNRVFTSNTLLSEFKVAEGNPAYAAIDKFLCTKDGKRLIQGVTCEKVVIPASVEEIGGYAFYNMRRIKSINLTNASTIGECAFYGASQLTDIDWGSRLETINAMAFQDCMMLQTLTFPSTLRHITGGQSFGRCSLLREVNFNDGLVEIGASSFILCTSLKSIKIPGTVTTWGAGAFTNCSSITTAEFGEGMTVIPPDVLSYATELTTVKLPNSTKKIDRFAFGYCQKLSDISFPDNLEIIDWGAFEFCSLKDLVIPKNVTTIHEYAFGYAQIENLQFNDKLQFIGKWAFVSNSFPQVKVNEGVTEIGEGAFGYNDRLISIELPASLTTLGNGVAQQCPNIKEFINNATTPQTLDDDPVSASCYAQCKLSVPESAVQAYKNAPFWRNFGSITSGIDCITDYEAAEIVEIYDISGMRLNELRNGINIVVLSNGQVRKIAVTK